MFVQLFWSFLFNLILLTLSIFSIFCCLMFVPMFCGVFSLTDYLLTFKLSTGVYSQALPLKLQEVVYMDTFN